MTAHDASGADSDGSTDGAVDAPHGPNVMFVTSQTFPASSITTLAVADANCNTAAQAVPLAGTFVAWVSLEGTNAVDRLAGHAGWVRPDNLPFANTASDIIAGRLFYPPRITELGGDLGTTGDFVATMTKADGTATAANCNFPTFGYGVSDGGTRAWTEAGSATCTTSLVHLYCFETDKSSVDVTPPPPSGKRAFVTSFTLSANGSLTSFNSECMLEGGQFVAFVATTGATAKQRVVSTGPWYRFDGVEWTADLQAFIAPLDVEHGGVYVDSGSVWTGATDPGVRATSSQDCTDWGTTTGSGINGAASRSDIHGFDNNLQGCGGSARVYCVEQ